MPPNAWNEFVKQQSKRNKNSPSQLSHLWKNKMSQLVTVHIDYLLHLHTKIAELQQKCSNLDIENKYLNNIITCDEPLSETQP
jgi:hypothetical protein